jgi:hypothetical protein
LYSRTGKSSRNKFILAYRERTENYLNEKVRAERKEMV